ncbi:MAG: hypothetical protein HYZ36_00555 [Pedosphaera parvula]|nr:hypothetical protein [Pedosphaera parvula]
MEILITGMGQRNAGRAIRVRLEQPPPTLVISSGFAGGLNPELIRGNIIFDADADFPLVDALRQAGARVARFHCSPTVVVSTADKQLLWQATGADAVEMESSVIRDACRQHGIPSATVRVISDAAHESLPLDFNRLLTENLTMDYGKLSLALLKAPGKIGELIRFQRKIQAAASRLAATLSTTLTAFSEA